MSKIKDVSDWERMYNDICQALLLAQKSLKEREAGLKSGVNSSNFARRYQITIRNVKNMNDTISFLGDSVTELQKSRKISSSEAQRLCEKLTKLKKGKECIDAKINTSRDNDNDRRTLFGGGSDLRGCEETEKTRELNVSELLQYQEKQLEEQDQLLDQLSVMLKIERERGKETNRELDRQEEQIDNLNGRAHNANERTKAANARIEGWIDDNKNSRGAALWRWLRGKVTGKFGSLVGGTAGGIGGSIALGPVGGAVGGVLGSAVGGAVGGAVGVL